jgi:hypothetical protein
VKTNDTSAKDMEKCPYCSVMVSSDQMKGHLSKRCPERFEVIVCEYCGKKYQRWAYSSHLKNVHPSEDRLCDICNVRVNVGLFEKHLKEKHPYGAPLKLRNSGRPRNSTKLVRGRRRVVFATQGEVVAVTASQQAYQLAS